MALLGGSGKAAACQLLALLLVGGAKADDGRTDFALNVFSDLAP